MCYFSHYNYDAAGERVLKRTGQVQQMQINAEEFIDFAELTNHTLYTNPYMTITDQEYTKHYYIEGQRVCSKLGGGMMYNPIGIHDDLNLINSDYITFKEKQELAIHTDADCVGLDGEMIGLPEAFNHLEGQPGMDNAERDQYFYHSDHLGSSAFITDAGGNATQHLQYLPYGVLFIEQHNDAAYNTPYKFSGKEKDLNLTNYNLQVLCDNINIPNATNFTPDQYYAAFLSLILN